MIRLRIILVCLVGCGDEVYSVERLQDPETCRECHPKHYQQWSGSMHAYAAAIDINTRHTTYWQWVKPGPDGTYRWSNEIPKEIVAIFEKHGFIWGGRWYHFDTMHFEYRPELVAK